MTPGAAFATMRRWPTRRWTAAGAGALAVAVVTGVPTALVPSGFFTRMTPVTWWSWPIWVVTAVLGGLVLASYVRTADPTGAGAGTGATGGLLGALAIGCPVCNKLVVLLLGFSGAMQVWAPLQPVLGLVSLALLGYALHVRLRTERACPVPANM